MFNIIIKLRKNTRENRRKIILEIIRRYKDIVGQYTTEVILIYSINDVQND